MISSYLTSIEFYICLPGGHRVKNKPILSSIFININKFDKLPSIGSSYDFVFFLSTLRISEQQMAIREALVDLLCLYSMSRHITPVKSQRFQFFLALRSPSCFVIDVGKDFAEPETPRNGSRVTH
jgi:hypothetical protein